MIKGMLIIAVFVSRAFFSICFSMVVCKENDYSSFTSVLNIMIDAISRRTWNLLMTLIMSISLWNFFSFS